MTAGELIALGAEAHHETQILQGLADQAQLLGLVGTAGAEGQELVARIHRRKRLTQELAAADAAYTAAVQAAVGRSGAWASVQVAGDVVRQCEAALKAAA